MSNFFNLWFGKYYDMLGAGLSFFVAYFHVPFLFRANLVDINLVDINVAINTAAALFSLIGSALGLVLTSAKVAEKLKLSKNKEK